MNTLRDHDAVIAAWLDDGPIGLPADTRQAITVGIRTLPRRGRGLSWPLGRLGLRPMDLRRLAAALGSTAVIVVAAALALNFLANGPGIGGPPGSVSSASPSPSAAPESTQPGASGSAPAETRTPEPTAEPTSTPTALVTWNRQSGLEDWPAPPRVELPDAGVETAEQVSSQWRTYSDTEGDTTPGDVNAVDISGVHIGLGCVGGEPKLRCIELALAGPLEDPIPLPEDAWYGIGIVLDVDSDGVPDYRYGVDNSDPGLGPIDLSCDCRVRGRVWRADLRTGAVEVVAISQATNDTLFGEFPTSDFPKAIFHLKNLGGRFYAWSSLIADGRVVATDYAPNVGWLELVDE